MLLGELFTRLDEVLRRPDKSEYIRQQAIACLRALHSSQEFDDNFVEWTVPNSNVTLDSNSTGKGTFTYSSDIRSPALIFAYDSIGNQLTEVKLLKAKEIQKRKTSNQSILNTSYRVGSKSISFQLSMQPYSFGISGYTHRPELSVTTNSDGSTKVWTDPDLLAYTDWLLDIYPAVVEDYVIGYVAASVGEKEISNTHLTMYRTVHLPVIQGLGTAAAS